MLFSGLAAAIGLTSCSTKSSDSDYLSDTGGSTSAPTASENLEELRGVWITNVDSDVLTSKAKISEMMDYLAANNFNVVYPVVWNKAYTLYPSDVMEEMFDRRMDPLYGDRDPLAELITEAHARGIEVVPWFEFGFASSYNIGGGPLLEAKPEWKALDKDGNLAKKNNFEWMNAFDPEVQAFMTSLVVEVVENYDIDGIQGDDRLPALPSLAGYDDYTVGLYKAEYGVEPPQDEKDPQWVQFRADLLTDYFKDLREAVKDANPNVVVSSSPSYYDWSLFEYLQDSYAWTNQGIADTIHPQAYRREIGPYKDIVDELVTNQFTEEQLEILSPGILLKVGSYVAPADYVREAVRYNRENGINGEVWFFYPGLRENNNEIGDILGNEFYTEPAALFYRNGETWRPKAIKSQFPVIETQGTWTVNPEYPGFFRSAVGSGETINYDVRVPVDATYRVFIDSLAGPKQSTSITVKLADGQTTVLDQRDPDNYGYIALGSIELNAGMNQDVVSVMTGADERRFGCDSWGRHCSSGSQGITQC